MPPFWGYPKCPEGTEKIIYASEVGIRGLSEHVVGDIGDARRRETTVSTDAVKKVSEGRRLS